MKRDLTGFLEEWRTSADRKPILLRGARQVGKSYLAREFGKSFPRFLEFNFELSPGLISIFERDLDPERIVRDLSIALDQEIIPGESLLFIDEIQECPKAVTALRYFYEKMPQLHVIAAGSLIEFILEETGLPVGRVMPLYLYPLSFMEFLSAGGHESLRQAIANHNPGEIFPAYIHEKALSLLGEYMAIGGMPEAVKKWFQSGNIKECTLVHQVLVDTYRQDFAKYAKKKKREYVEMVFNAIPRLMANKFVFSEVSREFRARELRPALELLDKAGVAHMVNHTAANGLPLGAEMNTKINKVVFVDVALAQSVLGLDAGEWILEPLKCIVNRGAIAEAFVGQELLAYGSPFAKSKLFYWVREKRASMAEVDYVIPIKDRAIPVEVKSGRTGSLKSLRFFLEKKKNSPYGLRFSQREYYMTRQVRGYPLYAISAAFNPS